MKLVELVFQNTKLKEISIFPESEPNQYGMYSCGVMKNMISKGEIVQFLVDNTCKEDMDYPKVAAHLRKLFEEQLTRTYTSMVEMLAF